MSLAALVIAPHGAETLPDGPEPTSQALAEAYGEAAERLLGVETWVVLTPHGLLVDGFITASATLKAEGFLPLRDGVSFARFPVDVPLLAAIAGEAPTLPLLPVSFGASSLPLDWGALIPLLHLARGEDRQVVVFCPSQSLPLPSLTAFGRAVAAAAARHGRQVGLIASADLCHTHAADGPYGFDPEAERLDREIVRAVQEDDLAALYRIPPERLAAGKPDGLPQIACLDGARQVAPLPLVEAVYDRPSYYGMLLAVYQAP